MGLRKTARKTVRRITKQAHKTARVIRKKSGAPARRLAVLRARNAEIDPNKIAIITLNGSYSCNPKYIDIQLRKEGKPYDVVWLLADMSKADSYPADARIANLNSPEGITEAYTAKIWLDNGVMFSERFEKRIEQAHIQTMHGSLGIKKLDNAILSRQKKGKHGLEVIRRESKNTDFVLTNSLFEEDAFKTVFWKDCTMLRLGHARTDILFDEDQEKKAALRERLYADYGIPVDHKLVLYAPTHRHGISLDDLNIDYPALCEALSQRFSGDFSVMVRFHHRTKGLHLGPESRAYDVTSFPDIQELMWVTDIAITDYSSWIYDFVLTRRPGFIYATDIEYYVDRTGFFYPLEETPFPLAKSNEELIANVASFDEDAYAVQVQEFLDDKVCVDDGHAAERAVKLIDRIMEEW